MAQNDNHDENKKDWKDSIRNFLFTQTSRKLKILDNPEETGMDRLKETWKAISDGENVIEAEIISQSVTFGSLIGGIMGAMFYNREIYQAYVRQHNTNIFEGKYRANRHMTDHVYLNLMKYGLKYGIKYGLFTGAFVSSLSLSIIYRNDIHYKDCALAGAFVGSIWRSHLGLRAITVNFILGSVFGLLFAGFTRTALKLGNTTIKELRHQYRVQF